MNLNSRKALVSRLRRGRRTRRQFAESHLAKTLAHQVRAMRDTEQWSQQELAKKLGTTQNVVYRLESSDYGRQTLTTLKKVAAEFDVALVVRFVPFSELVDWVSGTPRVSRGLDCNALAAPSFQAEAAASDVFTK